MAGKFLDAGGLGKSIPMNLLQPTGQDNNDTSTTPTGSALQGAGGPAATSASSKLLAKARLF